MNRPDHAKDLVGFLSWLGDRVEAIERDKAEERVSISEAARRLGYKPGFFHGHPWRVPGFDMLAPHSISEYEAWLTRPEAERRAEWDALPPKQRALLRGIAA